MLDEIYGPATPALTPTRWTQALADVVPAEGAGVSVFAGDVRFPAGASSREAAIAERLQFTAAEGPCLAACADGIPVLASEHLMASRWPIFYDGLTRRTPFRAILGFPMTPHPAAFGSIDLYLHNDHQMHCIDVAAVTEVAELIGAALLDLIADADLTTSTHPGFSRTPRATTMTAVGMLNVALDMTSEAALATLRARAFAADTSVDHLADDVVHRRIPLTDFADFR